jgi:hypothetical protein
MRSRLGAIFTALALLSGATSSLPALAGNIPSGQDFAVIERGRYLTALADCAACLPHRPDTEAALRGRPADRNTVRHRARREHHSGLADGHWQLDR